MYRYNTITIQDLKDMHVRDTGLKRPVVQRGDVDTEGEAKTKT